MISPILFAAINSALSFVLVAICARRVYMARGTNTKRVVLFSIGIITFLWFGIIYGLVALGGIESDNVGVSYLRPAFTLLESLIISFLIADEPSENVDEIVKKIHDNS